MNAIPNLLSSACQAVRFGSELIRYAMSFSRALLTPKAVLSVVLTPMLLSEVQVSRGAGSQARRLWQTLACAQLAVVNA